MTANQQFYAIQGQLLELIHQINQRCHGEEWVENCEYTLWFIVRRGSGMKYGTGFITDEEVLLLHQLSLSQRANGWWRKDGDTMKFVSPLTLWVRHYCSTPGKLSFQ